MCVCLGWCRRKRDRWREQKGSRGERENWKGEKGSEGRRERVREGERDGRRERRRERKRKGGVGSERVGQRSRLQREEDE